MTESDNILVCYSNTYMRHDNYSNLLPESVLGLTHLPFPSPHLLLTIPGASPPHPHLHTITLTPSPSPPHPHPLTLTPSPSLPQPHLTPSASASPPQPHTISLTPPSHIHPTLSLTSSESLPLPNHPHPITLGHVGVRVRGCEGVG